MDFGSLLHAAKENEKIPKKEIKYYSTKFEPPKKEERSKQLSNNIKKFLARKEAEEKQKILEAKIKREELLALRSQDRKAQRRVAVMLKRTKSANKSVIQDAIDNDNTAVTLAGPSQPDEDDYGYVSQEASAFYNKMMQKYNTMPEEDKFPKSKKNINTNLKEIKDRVRAAIQKEQEEALLPQKRKRKPKDIGEEVIYKEEEKPKAKFKPVVPPPMNFSELLKIAEKKQFEPIKIDPKVEIKEDERPMTKKQKREFEKEKAWRERKEKGVLNVNIPPKPLNKVPKLNSTLNNGKIPKISNPEDKKPLILKKGEDRGGLPRKIDDKTPKKSLLNQKSKLRSELEKPRSLNKPNNDIIRIQSSSKAANLDKTKGIVRKEGKGDRPKQFPPLDLKPKQFPPGDVKPKQFGPPDIRKKLKNGKQKPPMGHKRRILDDDSEYDSEMDDFIDDGPTDAQDYSKYISEIFGYDKSKYRFAEDEDDNMESSFSQMMKEEFISSRIGLMEDLEDMKLEAEEKKKKAIQKKKLMRK